MFILKYIFLMSFLSTALMGQFDYEFDGKSLEKRSSGYEFFPFSRGINFSFISNRFFYFSNSLCFKIHHEKEWCVDILATVFYGTIDAHNIFKKKSCHPSQVDCRRILKLIVMFYVEWGKADELVYVHKKIF